jgi:hypothetical protein
MLGLANAGVGHDFLSQWFSSPVIGNAVSDSQSLPPVLQALHKLEFDYADGDGMDFEPYHEFLGTEDTRDWFQAWTGNSGLDGHEYRIFGQDGTGGYAAIWLARDNEDLLDQPIVFFGSEGELGVVAANFSDYLWVLASDHGPYEAIVFPSDNKPDNPIFLAFAKVYATTPRRRIRKIRQMATAEFPGFESSINALCR